MGNKLSFQKLFEPACIGKVKLKNRLIMLPMATAYGTPSGEVTQRTIEHYVERAKGGVGLVTVGNISPDLPASAHGRHGIAHPLRGRLPISCRLPALPTGAAAVFSRPIISEGFPSVRIETF